MDKKQTEKLGINTFSRKKSSLEQSSGVRRWIILLSVVVTGTGVMFLFRSQPLTGQNLTSIINTVFSATSVISTIIQTIFTIWPNSKSSSTSSQTASQQR
jgi:hypothetical protein